MIQPGEHLMYVVLGYAGVVLIVGALIAWTWLSARRVKAQLAVLERKS